MRNHKMFHNLNDTDPFVRMLIEAVKSSEGEFKAISTTTNSFAFLTTLATEIEFVFLLNSCTEMYALYLLPYSLKNIRFTNYWSAGIRLCQSYACDQVVINIFVVLNFQGKVQVI